MVIYYGTVESVRHHQLNEHSCHVECIIWQNVDMFRFTKSIKGIPTRHLKKKHRRTALIIDGSKFGAQQTMPFLCFVTLVLLNLWKSQVTCFHLEYFFMWVFPKIGLSTNHQFWYGFSIINYIINHPFWDTPVFGNTHIVFFFMLWKVQGS